MADEIAPGQQAEQDLRNNGYNDEDINDWREQTKIDLTSNNFSEQDVKDYFGMKEPDMSSVKDFVAKNLAEYNKTKEGIPETSGGGKNQAQSFEDAFGAGMQLSIPGIIQTRNKPNMDIGSDPNWDMRLAKNIGTVAGDLPSYLLGGVIGGTVGGVVTENPIGAVVGAGMGTFAYPAMLRKALVDYYDKGGMSREDFLQRTMAIGWEGVKGAATGAAVELAGPVAGKLVGSAAAKLGASKLGQGIANSAGEFASDLATMTTVGQALEGHLPTREEFFDNAALMFGLHSVTHVAPKLMRIYADTGMKPAEVAQEVEKDPVLKGELASQDPDLPKTSGEPGGHLVNPNIQNEINELRQKNEELKSQIPPEDLAARQEENAKVRKDYYGMTIPGKVDLISPGVANRITEVEPSTITLKNGETVTLKSQMVPSGGGEFAGETELGTKIPDQPGVVAYNSKGEIIGKVPLLGMINGDGKTTPYTSHTIAQGTEVHPDYRRQGLATAMYDFVNEKISPLSPSDIQTESGKAFSKAYEENREGGGSGSGNGGDGNRPSMSEDGKAFLGMIGEQKEAPKTSMKHDLEDWYGRNIDRTQILRDALNRAGVEPSPEDSVTLLQLQSAASDTTKIFIEHETRDWHTDKPNGEGFQPILNDYKKEFPADKQYNDLKAYGIAARVVELAKRGITLKVDGKDADIQAAQRLVDNHPEYKQYMDRIVAYKNRVLDYMHGSGYFTPEQVKAMKDLNKSHFSFKRVQDFDPISGGMGTGSSKMIKRIYGEGGKLLDPILSTVRDTDAMLKLAQENQVKNKFVEDIEANSPNPELVFEKVKPKLKPITVQGKEIMKAFKDNDGIELDATTAEALTIFRPRDAVKMPDMFDTHNEGIRSLYRTSPLIAEDLNTISGQPAVAAAWAQVLAGFARTLSGITVGNPLFALRHIYRNIRTSPVYSQTGLRPLLDTMIHFPQYIGGGEAYKDFLYHGGSVGSITKFDTDYVNQKIYELDKEAPFIKKAQNVVTGTVGLSHWAIVAADNATRFAEYQRSIRQGKSPVEAAYNARNVIPDYQKAGLQRSALWQSAAFLRVHVNSEAAMFANINKDPVGVTSRALLWFTVPSILLYAANQGDKAIDDKQEWMKNTYEMTRISHWRPASGLAEAASVDPSLRRQMQDGSWQIDDGPVIKMPQAFTLGTAFSRGPIAGLEAWKAKDPKAVEEWAKHLASSLFAEPIPTAVVPFLEQYTNKNFFTGRPVVSPQNEKQMPAFQYTPYTTEVAKQLGKLVGTYIDDKTSFASPEVIDNTLRDWTSTPGGYALQLADAALHKAGIGNLAVKPARSIFETPFVREFFATSQPGNSQAVLDFYNNFKETQSFATSLKRLKDENNKAGALQLLSQHPERAFNMTSYDQAMNNLHRMVRTITEDSSHNYSANDKQQLIQPLMGKMVILSRDANEKYKAFQEAIAQRRKAGAQ